MTGLALNGSASIRYGRMKATGGTQRRTPRRARMASLSSSTRHGRVLDTRSLPTLRYKSSRVRSTYRDVTEHPVTLSLRSTQKVLTGTKARRPRRGACYEKMGQGARAVILTCLLCRGPLCEFLSRCHEGDKCFSGTRPL